MINKQRLLQPFLILITLLFASFFVARWVVAQQTSSELKSLGIALSPPTFELSANPGDFLENTIRLDNLSEKAISVTVDRRNFTALGEEGGVGLTEEETSYSLASWITVIPEIAEIPAKSSRSFKIQTKIPLNAEPGGHFGSVIFKVGGNPANLKQTGAAVAQELGGLILLKIAGRTTEMASLESFSTKSLWEFGPVEFEARVKNEGNVHLKPIGTVTIVDSFGKKVATIEVDSRNVLPGAVRKIPATWNKKSLLGKYTALISLTYGSQGQVLTSSTTFVGLPYKIAGIVIFVLTIIILIVYRRRKRFGLALRVLLGKEK